MTTILLHKYINKSKHLEMAGWEDTEQEDQYRESCTQKTHWEFENETHINTVVNRSIQIQHFYIDTHGVYTRMHTVLQIYKF